MRKQIMNSSELPFQYRLETKQKYSNTPLAHQKLANDIIFFPNEIVPGIVGFSGFYQRLGHMVNANMIQANSQTGPYTYKGEQYLGAHPIHTLHQRGRAMKEAIRSHAIATNRPVNVGVFSMESSTLLSALYSAHNKDYSIADYIDRVAVFGPLSPHGVKSQMRETHRGFGRLLDPAISAALAVFNGIVALKIGDYIPLHTDIQTKMAGKLNFNGDQKTLIPAPNGKQLTVAQTLEAYQEVISQVLANDLLKGVYRLAGLDTDEDQSGFRTVFHTDQPSDNSKNRVLLITGQESIIDPSAYGFPATTAYEQAIGGAKSITAEATGHFPFSNGAWDPRVEPVFTALADHFALDADYNY